MTAPQLPLDTMIEKSAEAADFMRLFSTPSRLLLMCFLSNKEASVGEIQEQLGFKQPGLSQQLAELRQAGVVQTRRESRQIYYSIADHRVAEILAVLVPIFCGPLKSTALEPIQKNNTASRPQLGEMAQWAIMASAVDEI